jgi:hypothetical protein
MKNKIVEKLAQWHNEFNRWNWPEDLKIFKPKNFDNLLPWSNDRFPAKYTKTHYISTPMNIIEKLIGKKEWLRWHWLHNLNETNEHFEEWFDDKDAYYAKYGYGHPFLSTDQE